MKKVVRKEERRGKWGRKGAEEVKSKQKKRKRRLKKEMKKRCEGAEKGDRKVVRIDYRRRQIGKGEAKEKGKYSNEG